MKLSNSWFFVGYAFDDLLLARIGEDNAVVMPFYTRNPSGIPTAWVQRSPESMAQLTLPVSADRMMHEYIEPHCLPAAALHILRSADHGAIGQTIGDWQPTVEQQWGWLRVADVRVEHYAKPLRFEMELSLNGPDPEAVRVEPCADGTVGADSVRQEMIRAHALPDVAHPRACQAMITASPHDLFAAGAEELLDQSKPFALPNRSSAICLARKCLSA